MIFAMLVSHIIVGPFTLFIRQVRVELIPPVDIHCNHKRSCYLSFQFPQSSQALREKANKVPIVLISLFLLDLLWLESLFNTFFRVHSVMKYSRILLPNIICAGSLWLFGMLITLDVPY